MLRDYIRYTSLRLSRKTKPVAVTLWLKCVVFAAVNKYTSWRRIRVKNHRSFDVFAVSSWKKCAILWIRHDFCFAFCQLISWQISVKMYSKLNIFLLQRQVLYVVENNSTVAQHRILNQTTTRWKKVVETSIRKTRRMSLHHNSIDSTKIDIKQIEIIKNNTTIVYVLMNILRDKWNMSALLLRLDENFFERSTRVHHAAFDDDDENDENDENENENDETMRMMKMMKTTMSKTTKRRRHVENNLKNVSKKIKMISKKKRSTCRLILNRLAIRMTSMWSRRKAKKTLIKKTLMKRELRRAVRSVRSIRSANFSILRRKRSRRLLRRLSDASSRSRRSTRNRHSIFDEVFDDRRKRRSKIKNDRFLTRKTSNRRLNVVVAQNFNRFCFVVW